MEDKKVIINIDPPEARYHSKEMKWVEFMARWLDSKFTIPGTKIKFGLDPLLSLFPIFGDLFTTVISGALIYTMHTQGASRKVVIKMILNSTVDAVIGSIPLIGSIFDVFYRANDRNVKLLREHYLEGKHEGSGNGLLLLVVILALAVVIGMSYAVYKLFEYLF